MIYNLPFFTIKNHKQMSETFSTINLPIDVVMHILRFDARFSIRGEKIIDKLNKNKHKYVIHFLVNKPLPHFRIHVREFREKCHCVYLPHNMQIHYIVNYDEHDKTGGLDIRLYKKCQLLSRVICE